ncbi:MAG: integration host factor subunit alpha [Gammaproteobacteria bacterium]
MALTKADLAMALFEEVGLNKKEAKIFVDEYFELIRETLESGEFVKQSGFGGLFLKDKNARPGRNPKTGVEVTIEPRRVVIFRAGQKLRAQVENESGQDINDSE